MTHFFQYWKPAEVKRNVLPGAVLDHSAGAQLSRVKVGDVVWVITVRDGDLVIAGRMIVGESLTDRQAQRRFGGVYSADAHIVAEAGTEEPYRITSLRGVADQLRFISPVNRDRLTLKNRRVDGKQLQAMRILSPETAAMLDSLWYGKESPETRELEHRISSGAGFGDPETNKKVETAAVALVTRQYRREGWTVESVEAIKCGFDLKCERDGRREHVEVKGVQGANLSFIITANEARQASQDCRFVLCVVTAALSRKPHIHRFTGDEFSNQFRLDALAFRASLRATGTP